MINGWINRTKTDTTNTYMGRNKQTINQGTNRNSIYHSAKEQQRKKKHEHHADEWMGGFTAFWLGSVWVF